MPDDKAIEARLEQAAQRCSQCGETLTPMRRRVLDTLLRSEQALGAYALIDKLAVDGRRPQPPTVYRALDFLMARGFVHKVLSTNAFVACCRFGTPHAAKLFVCRTCGTTAEVPLSEKLASTSDSDAPRGFHIDRIVMEVQGRCESCQSPPPSPRAPLSDAVP